MDLKKWEEYSVEEKKTIIYYWWHEFRRRFPVFEEWATSSFDQIVEMDIDLVFASAVILLDNNMSGIYLYESIKRGTLAQTLNRVLEYKTAYEKTGRFTLLSIRFLKTIVEDFNRMYPNFKNAGIFEEGEYSI